MRQQNFVQMDRLYHCLDLFGHPCLQVCAPDTGEVSKCSLELKCCGECSSPHSSGCVAAEEGIEHWVFQALLVLPAPGDHSPIAVRCVQMVAVTGKGKAGKRKRVPFLRCVSENCISILVIMWKLV